MRYLGEDGYYYHFDENKVSLQKFKSMLDYFHFNSSHRYDFSGDSFEQYLHRIDGPAIEPFLDFNFDPNKCSWYLNGDEYSFTEWLECSPISTEQKVELRFRYA